MTVDTITTSRRAGEPPERLVDRVGVLGHRCTLIALAAASMVVAGPGAAHGTAGKAAGKAGSQLRLVVPAGHGGQPIRAVAFSPDGKHVATAADDHQEVILWRVETGHELRRYRCEWQYGCSSLAFSPDGERLAGSGGRGTTVWQVRTSERLMTLDGGSSVAFSQDGRYLATGGAGAWVWSAASGALVRRFATGGVVAFSPDGRRLVIGGVREPSRIVSVVDGTEIAELSHDTEKETVSAVAWSSDGTRVITAGVRRSEDGQSTGSHHGPTDVHVWDAASGKEIMTLEGHEQGILSLGVSPSGEHLLTGGYDRSARVWSLSDGKPILRVDDPDFVQAVAYAPDGDRFIVNRTLRDAHTGLTIRTLRHRTRTPTAADIAADGKTIATSAGTQVRIWRASERRSVSFLLDTRMFHPRASVRLVRFAPRGKRLLVVGFNGYRTVLMVWNVDAREELMRVDGMAGAVWSAAFSPDGRSFLTGGSAVDTRLALWRTRTGQLLRRFAGHERDVRSVGFSADGTLVVSTADDRTLRIWNAATGEEVARVEDQPFEAVAAVPGGHFIVTAPAGGEDDHAPIGLREILTGRLVRGFGGNAHGTDSFRFSADGTRMLTRGQDFTARLWDVGSGRELQRFEHGAFRVDEAALTSDGTHALTLCGSDATTRLWDTRSGKQIASLVSFDDGGWAVVAADGRIDVGDLSTPFPLYWIHARRPLETVPLERHFARVRTPGLLAELLR